MLTNMNVSLTILGKDLIHSDKFPETKKTMTMIRDKGY
jgi:hypothetical protein